MTARAHANVRSYYFRDLCAERALENYGLADFRSLWRRADIKAREWRRRMANRYNHATQAWEQGA